MDNVDKRRAAIIAITALFAFTIYAAPTGALDQKTAECVFTLIMDLSKKYGKTVIMVTHSRELAYQADRVIDLGK